MQHGNVTGVVNWTICVILIVSPTLHLMQQFMQRRYLKAILGPLVFFLILMGLFYAHFCKIKCVLCAQFVHSSLRRWDRSCTA